MGDERSDPPASPSSERHESSGKVCEHCGTAIDTSEWYPVTKRRDADGTLQFYPFCGEDCQDAWLDRHGE